MTLTKQLVTKAIQEQGLKSAYELSKITGIEKTKIYAWLNELSEANAETTLILMKLAHYSVDDALSIVTENKNEAGRKTITKALDCILCKIKSELWRRIDKTINHAPITGFIKSS